ncbi:MAG TPA: alpha/beta fold hydrolase [Dehalococcoidia bacterium]|nr:alpha/beta fold hydrolase [Dehalococcoidia bacterium]
MSLAAGVDERYIELQDGRIRTRVLSAGSGPPVVFLHGFSGLAWDPFLTDLAGRHTVYAPEHPGSGDSAGLEHLDTIWDLVLYYNDLLDALDLPAAALIGHSFGGMVAAEVAANNPERATRLVLIAPLGLWRDDYPVADIAGIPQREMMRRTVHDQRSPLARLVLPPRDDPEALFRASVARASVLHFIWPIPDKGLHKRLHRVKAPTLIVWGRQDGLAPPLYAEEFAARIPKAQVELIDQAAHLVHLEQREAVLRAVEAFLG